MAVRENYKYNTLVSGTSGNGNDEILNDGYRESDGSIYYYGYYHGSKVVFKYSEGDGNDKIYGFRKDSTLSISGGAYSTTKSGDNVIVTVGAGKITLIGAAGLDTLNIKGEEANIFSNVNVADFGGESKESVCTKSIAGLGDTFENGHERRGFEKRRRTENI